MWLFALRKLLAGIVLAVVITLVTYLLLSASFEDVVRSRLGESATPETVAAMMTQLGYDRPVLVQYFSWLGSALTGDFGISLANAQPVAPTVIQRLSVTLSLIVPALILVVVISAALGVWSASRGGIVDRIAQILSMIGHVIPNLLFAIGLVVVFAVQLRWLPATGFTPISEDPGAWARSITLPVIVLVIGGVASLTAQIRGRMIDELRKDYVRTLRTRGLSPSAIVLKHALRNAGGPALTVLSLEFISMFGSALIIENVFVLPGYGSYAFNAALNGDIPAILCVTTFGVLLVTIVNLITDLVQGWLNPKARIH